MKLVVGIVHLVSAKDGLQATLIKHLIVGHERKYFNQGFYLLPNLGEDGGILRITLREAVYTGATIFVVIGFRLNERVETVHNRATTHNYNTNGANRTTNVVSCLKIYCGKILYILVGIRGNQLSAAQRRVS